MQRRGDRSLHFRFYFGLELGSLSIRDRQSLALQLDRVAPALLLGLPFSAEHPHD
jgi:hypothetical protein